MDIKNQEKSEVYRFSDCELDADRRELRAAGKLVTMQPKAFELLLYLVRNRHRAVDKEELQDALWPRSIVTETALTRCVMKARRAVADDADRQEVIKTVHGHGYRFIAQIHDVPREPAGVAAHIPAAPVSRRLVLLAIAAGLAVAAGVLWRYIQPPGFDGEVRLAVLPVENATGNEELDWTRMGLMALMNRMLEDQGVTVVSGNNVTRLAGDTPLEDLLEDGSAFRDALARTTAATHLVAATLGTDGGLYRLTYTFAGGKRPERRTVVGPEPAGLIRDVVASVTHFATEGPPSLERMSFVSSDDFLNEAYARGMALQFEGRPEEAQRLFQIITEQEPELFWPRYEYALAARNLRDFDNAERMLIELHREAQQRGDLKQQAAATNSLGVMYMGQRRNDEALTAFETAARIGAEVGDTYYQAVANINLGLLAKNRGDLDKAYEHMREAERIYRDSDIQSPPGTLHNNLSGILILQGKLDEAERYSLAAIENFQLTGQRLFESYALARLSTIQRHRGLLDQAEDSARRAKVVREELGDRRGTSASLLSLADIAFDRGDLTRAQQYAQQARDIGVEIDDQDVMMDALATIAKAELALGLPREAAAHYAAAEAIARNAEDRMNAFSARYGQARTWIALGDFDRARTIADNLISESIEHERRREETAGHNLYAEIAMTRGRYREAVASLEQVLAIAQEIGDAGLGATANAKLAESWLELGEIGKADVHLGLVLAERPADGEMLKLQARLAAANGDLATAARLMTEARTMAGQRWQSEDDDRLMAFQQAAMAAQAHPAE